MQPADGCHGGAANRYSLLCKIVNSGRDLKTPLVAWFLRRINLKFYDRIRVYLRSLSISPSRPSLKQTVKPGFHYPSSRAELTTRELGCIFWHPSTRAVNSGVKKCTRVHGPSTRAVNSGNGNRALLSSGLKETVHYIIIIDIWHTCIFLCFLLAQQ